MNKKKTEKKIKQIERTDCTATMPAKQKKRKNIRGEINAMQH